MLGPIQNSVLGTKSFADWKLIFISLVLPLCLIVALRRIFNEGKRKAMKEGETSRKDYSRRRKKKNKKFQSCYDFTSILGWETDTMTNAGPQRGPISLTIAEALGCITHEITPAQYQCEPNSAPGPNNQMTIGEALGLLGRSGDKKYRKWMVSMRRAVARFSCGDPTAGDDRLSGGKPLISLMKEMDRADQARTMKRVLGVKKEKRGEKGNEGTVVCHVCSRRSKNATLVPCEHAYCRVCSREIWINTRSCPICKTHIVEVLDTL